MALYALDRSATYEEAPAGWIEISDWELVRLLQERDGEVPDVAPAHLVKGRCKYASFYTPGECPWCRTAQLRRAA